MARKKQAKSNILNLKGSGYLCMMCGQGFRPHPDNKNTVECPNSMCPGKAPQAQPEQPDSKEQE